MSKTDRDRYDQTIQYIRTISLPLEAKIKQKVGGNQIQYGQMISLGEGNASFIRGVVSNQHHAIRALVLCQNLFLPKGNLDNNKTVTHCKGMSENEVKEAVLMYATKPVVTLNEFRNVAERERMGVKNHNKDNILWLTRSSMVFDGGTNCYGAVNIWLVKSGLCSLDWYMNNPCDAYNVNQVVGNGQEHDLNDLGSITPGWIFNIHDANDQNICHWGVILETDSQGRKWAVASNTDPGAMGTDNQPRLVQFRTAQDTGAYGHFLLSTSIEVCKAKYNSHQVKLRVLDPTTHRANYY